MAIERTKPSLGGLVQTDQTEVEPNNWPVLPDGAPYTTGIYRNLRKSTVGFNWLAEREGFEPSVPLRGHSISSAAQSAALSPLRLGSAPMIVLWITGRPSTGNLGQCDDVSDRGLS